MLCIALFFYRLDVTGMYSKATTAISASLTAESMAHATSPLRPESFSAL